MRRDFLKKLTYVAPLMITFQMDNEAEAKSKSTVSPTTKIKKKKGTAKKSA